MVTAEAPEAPYSVRLIERNNDPSITIGWAAPLDNGGV